MSGRNAGNLAVRVGEVFLNPAKLFARLEPAKPWLDILLVCMLISACSSWLFWRSTRVTDLRSAKRTEAVERYRKQLGEAAIQSLLANRSDPDSFARGLALRSAVGIFASVLAVAAIVHFVCGIAFLKPNVRYRYVLSIVAHTYVVVAVLQAAMWWFRFNLGSLDAPPSLAGLFQNIPWDSGGSVPHAIASLNIITLWWLGLMAGGISVAFGLRRWWPTTAALWTLYVCLSMSADYIMSIPVLSDMFRHGPRT